MEVNLFRSSRISGRSRRTWQKSDQSCLFSPFGRGLHKILRTQTIVWCSVNSFMKLRTLPVHMPFHINRRVCPGPANWGNSSTQQRHATGYYARQSSAYTHAWPTNFYSLYLIWLQNLGEAGRPPQLMSQRAEFLLLLLPSSFPRPLVSTHALLWHQSAGSVGRFKLRMPPLHQ